MAGKDFESDDPMEFVAMRFPAPAGTDVDAEMARTFVEEYALMGMPRARVLQLFRTPAFTGTHRIWESRGEEFVKELLDEVYGPTRPLEVK